MSMARKPDAAQHHRHAPHPWPTLPGADELDQASMMFRALGDPARLRLLTRLADGEVCVTELADVEKEKLTTVSARLQTLHEARLVKRRRESKHVYYALSDSHVLQLVRNAIEHASEKQ
jgi:DNA-binding transcriptional ArsR family regulator